MTRAEPAPETLCFYNLWRWTKYKNMVLSSTIHHRQNPLELNCQHCHNHEIYYTEKSNKPNKKSYYPPSPYLTYNKYVMCMTFMYTSMEWGNVSELQPPTSYRWCMGMESHGWIIQTRENSWFVQQNALVFLPADSSSSKAGETWQTECWHLPTKNLFHTRSVLQHAANLRYGTYSFNSTQKEVVLWAFIILKNPIILRQI
jgi:hypothetical protein